jgi:hypothetical protein
LSLGQEFAFPLHPARIERREDGRPRHLPQSFGRWSPSVIIGLGFVTIGALLGE